MVWEGERVLGGWGLDCTLKGGRARERHKESWGQLLRLLVQDIHTKLLWTVSLCLHDVLTTATIHSLVCLQPALPLLCPYSCTWAVAEFKSLHSWLNYLRVIIQVIRNTHPVRKYNYLTPNDAYMCTIIGTTHNWCIKCHRTCMQFPNNVTIVWNNTYLKGVNPEKDF